MAASAARICPCRFSTTAYNAANQLTQWGTANLFYDLNGNMTSSGTDGYTWDARNRLVSTLSGASFQYDAFGRRVTKSIAGATTNFLYDGVNPVQELSGGAPTANLLSGGIDEVFQRTDSAGARSFLADALGSTLALTDSSGALQTQYTYEPFGNTTLTGSTTANTFAYTGREFDATGLYYYRARYYQPQIGRFISEDPLPLRGDTNLYAYVDNDPVNALDPMRLCKIYVKFNKVIKGLPGYHAYIVTADPSGQMMGFRGGPGQDGNIATLYGPYDKYFPDYNPGKTPCKKVLDNNEPCRQYNVQLESILDAIASDKIPYSSYPFLPGSKNSNSVISEAFFVLGLPVPTPPVWAPGWGTPLFPFGNGGPKSGPAGPGGSGGGGPLP